MTADATAARASPGSRFASWPAALDRIALPALLALAAMMRLPDLVTRGTWDSDQGHDMLVLRLLVRDGIVPLLGPPTSIGDVHHGAWYYYLLSPAAAVTGGDSPLAVVGLIALAGIAAVGVVWWLARSMGGPVAGAVAGLAMALSAAAIDESTFIWNPNLVALSSAIALAGAWRARAGGDPRWWLVAAIGTAITMQCHVLGIALLPIMGVAFVADARHRSLGRVPSGVALVFLIAYLPLLVNEATTGLSESRAAIDYLTGDREAGAAAIPVRFAIVGLRVISWPLTGLITAGFIAATIATAVVIGIGLGRARAGGPDASAARRLGLGLVWTTLFLAVAAPSLASVVPGLPNDHYHAFADPMVFALVGLGAAAAARARSRGAGVPATAILAPMLAAVGLAALVAWNITHLPPAIHPDGGYPAGQAAGDRVDAALSSAGVGREEVVRLRSLPAFKSTEALAYPLALVGRAYVADVPGGVAPGSAVPDGTTSSLRSLVILCDDRFAIPIGAACGGPAESGIAPDAGNQESGPLLVRFEAAPGRFISVYGPPSG